MAGLITAELIQRSPGDLAVLGMGAGIGIAIVAAAVADRHSLAVLYSGAALLTGALVDLPTASSFAGISGLGALTILLAGLGVLMAAYERSRGAGGWLLAATVWAAAGFIWAPITLSGLQTVLVMLVFLLCIRSASAASANKGAITVDRAMIVAILLGSGFYAATVIMNGPGSSGLVSPRAFGLSGLIFVAWLLASVRYRSVHYLWLLGLVCTLMLLSLSRAAILTAFLVMPLTWIASNGRIRILRTFVVIASIAAIFYVLFHNVATFRERFTEGDVVQVAGSLNVNASGRFQIWPLVWDSAKTSPLLGHGAGSAAVLTDRTFDSIGHPHNDYLRMFHDFGIVGLSMWVVGITTLVGRTARAWKRADLLGLPEARLHLSALLALIAVSISMFTDNSMTYLFVMAPLGILVGLSVGTARRMA
ncbi:MAG: O-antigen ligase family protein [Actinomycetota bacterium]